MNVLAGLMRIRIFWPGVRFQMLGAERLDVMHRRLDLLSHGPMPETMRELIRRMDEVGLAIKGDLVVLEENVR